MGTPLTSQMLVWTTLWVLAVVAMFLHHYRRKGSATATSGRLPPGPPGWPVVGNIFDLGTRPHAALAGLKTKYGPLIWLRLGFVNTMVVCSAEVAMEMFKKHDQAFINRRLNEALKSDDIFSSSLSLAEHGPYWRMLRRLFTTELFSQERIKQTRALRRKSVDQLIKWISDEANKVTADDDEAAGTSIELASFVFATFFNMISNLTLSTNLISDPTSSTKDNEFYRVNAEVKKLTAKPKVADFFPFLSWLDPQGIKKEMKQKLNLLLEYVGSLVEERRRMDVDVLQHRRLNMEKDFLDVLLDFEGNGKDEPTKIPDRTINMLILELFMAGIEGTLATVEWAMTELLRNPEVMKNVRAEIAQVVGHERKIEESDIENLHYLRSVTKETMRLHPPGPILFPHTVVQDTEFMGYLIPKDTQVLINAWALGRDSSTWDDPLSFKPERFLDSKIDYRGQNFEFIPFGAGRRMCPGLPLGHQMVHLVLGSLLQSFEWVLENGVTPETMDMGETLGTSLRKAIPLKAIPKLLVV